MANKDSRPIDSELSAAPDAGGIDFSIVIPCLNGETTLRRQLSALVSQSFHGRYEVLVADNGSTDSTVSIIEDFERRYPWVRRVDAGGRKGINHARNRGIDESGGNFILFCDSDDEVDRDWLQEMASSVSNGSVAVGGTLDRRLPGGERLSIERRLYTMFWDIPWPAGANCGFSRSVFEAVGKFDEELMGGADETDYFWRIHFAGYSTDLVEGAIVKYFVRAQLKQVFRQAFNYGASHVRLYAKYRTLGMPRSNPLRSLAVIGHSCVVLLSARKRSPERRKAVERLGAHLGRIRGSIQERVIYL
ncbi:glycosyltransferase family 2 protein [Pseudarthrobacter sp. NBSH8]|uniref:glycosyltransferase n=1 Tax=Pseudarthrobacter sp. NBSH8 TaxID=2596911 RepID=UPI0016284036|nr:glycosyltransferase [Pseudarthrobacter sp. NBSH8]QNE15587.1 glycosyltransferase [Pseudarthrobacter sp. NBSH8]